ncbi:adenylyltransferase/cytidyltransferase family protein [Pontibacter silvestris]|uniref:Adenylyltransferase/cytidyltransferase family protein n=1 Tax=Pontibacter silvestris TaxID=2305183 RepID=A0ABW4WZ47_9BACT|nr:adenylyltransferase/cytidyltransferase family protein [Pontibacter silvestris]MCC9137578.1 adenylyltransferase/cytidyltransferase family protein [Pontibacter silvestris]
MEKKRKVMVTGCFDLLHSGHIAFLKEAASYGDLHVCIGNDENVYQLKGRYPVNSQEERRYMIEALACTTSCHVNKGYGIIDFLQELDEVQPDIFVVNEDGATPAKAEICRQRNIEYKVSHRIPHENLPARSTTSLRTECIIPFRIDLAGGWLDQPWVSKYHPGPVLTISIEPTINFNNRSGMASSTRNKALELWRTAIPSGDREKLAKVLFTYENPPGTKEVAGSQDALGIVLPGLNRLYYNGSYWPEQIESVHEDDILDWLEEHLYLVTLGPRTSGYVVLENTNLSAEGAGALADAAESCWEAIRKKDIKAFGDSFRRSFEAQVNMFPNMVDEQIMKQINVYTDKAAGWKLSGAGGGGYIILVAEQPIENAIKIKVRRRDDT